MSETGKWEIPLAILDRIPVLLIILGVAVVLLGFAGGVTYNSWFEIKDPIARYGAIGFGLIVFIMGVVLSKGTTRLGDPKKYGVAIQYPAEGDEVSRTDVRGTLKRSLPDGYALGVFRIFLNSNNFVPVGIAQIDSDKGTWTAHGCAIGGSPGDKRAFSVNIVGRSGRALIKFHNEAVRVHRDTMRVLKDETGKDSEFLPSIEDRTEDMHECTRVHVRRNKDP